MASFAVYVLCLVIPYLLWSCQSWFHNYQKAQQSGFPILVCPANTDNPLWIIFSVTARPLLAKYLPSFVFDRLNAGIYGWEYRVRYDLFARLGPAFMLVTPGKNELLVADPEITCNIVNRRLDFEMLPIASKLIGLFGPNLTAVRIPN